jgi:hypothetical protein
MTQYVSKALAKKICIECKVSFDPVNRTQKFCDAHCRETNKTKLINGRWTDRVYVDPSEKPRRDLTRIMRGDFRDDRWSGTKYNACRG